VSDWLDDQLEAELDAINMPMTHPSRKYVFITDYEVMQLKPHQWGVQNFYRYAQRLNGMPDRRYKDGRRYARYMNRLRDLSQRRFDAGVINGSRN